MRAMTHIDFHAQIEFPDSLPAVWSGKMPANTIFGHGADNSSFKLVLIRRANRIAGNAGVEQGAFKSISVYVANHAVPVFVILDGDFTESEVTPSESESDESQS